MIANNNTASKGNRITTSKVLCEKAAPMSEKFFGAKQSLLSTSAIF